MSRPQSFVDPTLSSPEVRDFEAALRQRVIGQDRAVRRRALGTFDLADHSNVPTLAQYAEAWAKHRQ